MKICPVCNKPFDDPKHPNSIYCSHTCHGLSKRKRGLRICPGCGKQFEQPLASSKYCSAQCGFKHRQHPPKDPTKRRSFQCLNCGTEHETWAYRKTRFCSIACAKQHRDITENRALIEHICLTCGKSYPVKPSQVRHRGSSYCSKECFADGLSDRRRGKNNPMYSGGVKFPYRGSSWSRQRKRALGRDGHKCVICGRMKSISVHHIIPYREFNGDHETANQLGNLVTLCRKHHNLVERHGYPCPRPLF